VHAREIVQFQNLADDPISKRYDFGSFNAPQVKRVEGLRKEVREATSEALGT
jgi:hypothetical protein